MGASWNGMDGIQHHSSAESGSLSWSKPATKWTETSWAWTSEESLVDHQQSGRLCVATLLPFHNGKPDWGGFERSIQWMIQCASHFDVEICFVLNADTGYIFNLDLDLYRALSTIAGLDRPVR